MKKLMFVMVLVMAALVVNAQRTPVKTADLQKSIIDRINKDYVGYVIKDATKVVANNVTTYEVAIVKGVTSETLVFDKDGKFLNKMAMTTGTKEKSGNAHLAAHKPVQKRR
jgi:translation initiation factor 2 beta subunit (eIF-2beta)/eIF-5